MKGFFKWFRSSTKMKRWILVILVGIVLACYGMAEILTAERLDFLPLLKIILCFVVRICFSCFWCDSYAKKNARTISSRNR